MKKEIERVESECIYAKFFQKSAAIVEQLSFFILKRIGL